MEKKTSVSKLLKLLFHGQKARGKRGEYTKKVNPLKRNKEKKLKQTTTATPGGNSCQKLLRFLFLCMSPDFRLRFYSNFGSSIQMNCDFHLNLPMFNGLSGLIELSSSSHDNKSCRNAIVDGWIANIDGININARAHCCINRNRSKEITTFDLCVQQCNVMIFWESQPS